MKPVVPANLDLNFIKPTLAYDGSVISINEVGVPTIIFFQVRKTSGDQVSADVVSSIRLNSIDQLKDLQRTITETIENHNSREK